LSPAKIEQNKIYGDNNFLHRREDHVMSGKGKVFSTLTIREKKNPNSNSRGMELGINGWGEKGGRRIFEFFPFQLASSFHAS